MDRFAVAACQTDFPPVKSNTEIGPRVEHMLAMIDSAVVGYRPFFPVKLVVFPEFAHTPPIYPDLKQLRERLGVTIPNEHTEAYQKKARQHDVYIQTGTFLEIDPKYPGALFNTSCLIGPEGIISKYRKINTWLPWEVHTSPHDIPDYNEELFPVADTSIGKIGCAICYDWIFPESIRQLTLNGAEILIRVSAYMDPWGATAPMDWWTVVNRCRALENMAYVVASNQGANYKNYPPFSWPGGSMLIDFDGRILAQADPGPGEKIVVSEIDLNALRHARAQRTGHNFLAHLRASTLSINPSRHWPPATFNTDPNTQQTVDDLEEKIRTILAVDPWKPGQA